MNFPAESFTSCGTQCEVEMLRLDRRNNEVFKRLIALVWYSPWWNGTCVLRVLGCLSIPSEVTIDCQSSNWLSEQKRSNNRLSEPLLFLCTQVNHQIICGRYFRPVFLNNFFTYVAQITFAKNCMAHYLVSMGYAFYAHKSTNKCDAHY